MIFGNKLLIDEIARLREENARKDKIVVELIDKFVHNRQPERLVVKDKVVPQLTEQDEGMGDPVSRAERDAWESSKPKD